MDAVVLRPLQPGDHAHVIVRLDEWWGGRSMTGILPRLFFDHFPDTSRIAVDPVDGATVGFLIGFRSQADPHIGYIHFVGVHPDWRGRRVGRTLYEWFFGRARELGCTRVECITSPVNTGSIAFHRAMGFSVHEHADHEGPGEARMVFDRPL